jgi:ADP-ribose pyrophosphatase YjhB (NUDIX family)
MKQDCALCVVQRENRILFVRQAYDLHLWTFPGGTVEPGESYSAAAVRELSEETGLVGKVNGLLCFRTRSDQTIAVFDTDILGGKIVESVPGEIEAVHWFDREDLEKDPHIELFPGFVAMKALTGNLRALCFYAWTGGSGSADMFF